MLTGSRPLISCRRRRATFLLAIRAEAVLGHVHDLRAGLGVLELRDVDVAGPMPAISNAARRRRDRRDCGALERERRAKTSNDPNRPRPHRGGLEETGRSVDAVRAFSSRHSISATPPSPGEQNMYFVSGSMIIGESSDLLVAQRRCVAMHSGSRAVPERLRRHLAERDAVMP